MLEIQMMVGWDVRSHSTSQRCGQGERVMMLSFGRHGSRAFLRDRV
jgi:hypothetical protein